MIALKVWAVGAVACLLWLLWQNRHDLFARPVRPSGFVVLLVLSAVWFIYLPLSWILPKD